MNRYLTLVTCGSVRPSFVKNLRQNKKYAVEHFHYRPAVSDGERLADSVGTASVQFAEVGRQVAGFFLEQFDEVGRVVETQVEGDFLDHQIAVSHQSFGFEHDALVDER